uniref:Uncharacterized protein n=1 Tax=Glossina austeni TaxID=7395 RepID=A0A1A9VLG4_GLOAU
MNVYIPYGVHNTYIYLMYYTLFYDYSLQTIAEIFLSSVKLQVPEEKFRFKLESGLCCRYR